MPLSMLYFITGQVIWGLLPIFWKLLSALDPLYLLAARIVWSAFFCGLCLSLSSRWRDSHRLLRNGPLCRRLGLASLFATVNWGLFILAVNTGHIFEAGLSSFINPIVCLAASAVVFGESLAESVCGRGADRSLPVASAVRRRALVFSSDVRAVFPVLHAEERDGSPRYGVCLCRVALHDGAVAPVYGLYGMRRSGRRGGASWDGMAASADDGNFHGAADRSFFRGTPGHFFLRRGDPHVSHAHAAKSDRAVLRRTAVACPAAEFRIHRPCRHFLYHRRAAKKGPLYRLPVTMPALNSFLRSRNRQKEKRAHSLRRSLFSFCFI